MYKQTVIGKGCIVARIVADSESSITGTRITTFELEYPRFIHSEFMTHRMFSRNAMSSRAVPIQKMIDQVRINPAMPIHWGAHQKGMQADNQLQGDDLIDITDQWLSAAEEAADYARTMNDIGAHKQIVNRILEPYQVMKTVVTATEWNNFWWLRAHKDAQPEIRELAECMKTAYDSNKPEKLRPSQWHVPYYYDGIWNPDTDPERTPPYDVDCIGNTLDDALKVSASCCAQVSFRLNDDSLEKAKRLYGMLVESKPVHASPFEHQATLIKDPSIDWEENYSDPLGTPLRGITHFDRDGDAWSGNFKHWIQHRQLIKDHVKLG